MASDRPESAIFMANRLGIIDELSEYFFVDREFG